MGPLVLELKKAHGIDTVVCVTGQHRAMLDQVLSLFQVRPDFDLAVMRPGQTLVDITTSVLPGVARVLAQCQPDVVLVHGDTTTSMSAAMASFYQQIPVGHVEAGLRTYKKYSPFPEEMNRRLITSLARYFFAPTVENSRALAREGVTEQVYVTGNTGIDAMRRTVRADFRFHCPDLAAHDFSKRTLLVTAHRRENLGQGLRGICQAVRVLCARHPDLRVIWPVHRNPAVHDAVWSSLGELSQVVLTDPVDVEDMHNALRRCYLVLTDSGGLQEEAPYLGKPALVMRAETERPEGVAAGTAVVVGVEESAIVSKTEELLADRSAYEAMSRAANPYGDGHASERIVSILSQAFSERPTAERQGDPDKPDSSPAHTCRETASASVPLRTEESR
jgi:UDP-N-acetylglucosamine 2-epimerase (non-hydrolysing)